ncbi:MAG TPA: membrane protein insertase YidC, partial [Chitinophagaceae bacterium]|nr:membrane protein insertase YidC [Chitinophagaceae bacterium]
MKFDRNTVIGFVILAALFFGYFFYTNQEQATYRKEQARLDSLKNANKPISDTLGQKIDAARADSVNNAANAGDFQTAANGSEEIVTVSNELFTIAFTNKGGQPKWVELRKFKNMDSGHVRLAADDFDKIGYVINTGNNRVANTSDLYFQPAKVVKNPDSSQVISFLLSSSDSSGGTSIVHQFVIKPGDYMLDFEVQLNGANKLLTNGVMNLTWNYTAAQQESDISFEKQNTQVGYMEDGEFDYHTIGRRNSVDFSGAVKWVGLRQRFFNSYLIAKESFSSGRMSWELPSNEKKILAQATTDMKVQLPVASIGKAGFNLFYGPA